MPEYTTPASGVIREIFSKDDWSERMLGCGFSLARTTPLEHRIPSEGRPWPTAANAYSICASFPEGENVVKLQSARMHREGNGPEGVAICHCCGLVAGSLRDQRQNAARFWAFEVTRPRKGGRPGLPVHHQGFTKDSRCSLK